MAMIISVKKPPHTSKIFFFVSCVQFRASSWALNRPLNIYLSEYFASLKKEKDQEIKIAQEIKKTRIPSVLMRNKRIRCLKKYIQYLNLFVYPTIWNWKKNEEPRRLFVVIELSVACNGINLARIVQNKQNFIIVIAIFYAIFGFLLNVLCNNHLCIHFVTVYTVGHHILCFAVMMDASGHECHKSYVNYQLRSESLMNNNQVFFSVSILCSLLANPFSAMCYLHFLDIPS